MNTYEFPIPDTCFELPQHESEDWADWPLEKLDAFYAKMKESELKCYSKFNSDWLIAYKVYRDRYSTADYDLKRVIQSLGEPDIKLSIANIHEFDPPRDEVVRDAIPLIKEAGKIEYYIYFWRGWHDYLWFRVYGNEIQSVDLYYAYE